MGSLLRILPEKDQVEIFGFCFQEQNWTVRVNHGHLDEDASLISLWMSQVCEDYPEEQIVKVYFIELQGDFPRARLLEFRHGFLTVTNDSEPIGYWATATQNPKSFMDESKGWIASSEDVCLISWERAVEFLGHDLRAIVEEPKPWLPPSPRL